MASAMARFLYTLRDTDAAPAATNGHDRATLAHAHEFSDRTATTRSCSQDRNTHRAWRNAETTARTNKHHDRRDNCATNNTTIAETTAEQTTPRSQRQLRNKHATGSQQTCCATCCKQTAYTDRRRDNCKTNNTTKQRQLQNKQHHGRRENCRTNDTHVVGIAARTHGTHTHKMLTQQFAPRRERAFKRTSSAMQNKWHMRCWNITST